MFLCFVFCFCLFDSEESAFSCRVLKSGKSNDGRVVNYCKVEGSLPPFFCLSSIVYSKAGSTGKTGYTTEIHTLLSLQFTCQLNGHNDTHLMYL